MANYKCLICGWENERLDYRSIEFQPLFIKLENWTSNFYPGICSSCYQKLSPELQKGFYSLYQEIQNLNSKITALVKFSDLQEEKKKYGIGALIMLLIGLAFLISTLFFPNNIYPWVLWFGCLGISGLILTIAYQNSKNASARLQSACNARIWIKEKIITLTKKHFEPQLETSMDRHPIPQVPPQSFRDVFLQESKATAVREYEVDLDKISDIVKKIMDYVSLTKKFEVSTLANRLNIPKEKLISVLATLKKAQIIDGILDLSSDTFQVTTSASISDQNVNWGFDGKNLRLPQIEKKIPESTNKCVSCQKKKGRQQCVWCKYMVCDKCVVKLGVPESTTSKVIKLVVGVGYKRYFPMCKECFELGRNKGLF